MIFQNLVHSSEKKMNKVIVVLNDRFKLAEELRKRGLIESNDKHYLEIIDHTKSTAEQILEKAEYYKVKLGANHG